MRNDKVLVSIKWRIEDIKDSLKQLNLNPSNNNVERLFKESHLVKDIEERSITIGQDIIEMAIREIFAQELTNNLE